MRAGIHFWNYTMPGQPAAIPAVLADTAHLAEEGGFDQFTVMDHWFQMDRAGDAAEPMLEAFTTLGFAAAKTQRMRLAPLVVGVTYRHPGLLAKTVTTLDVLSGGRAALGIGAAWYEREHHGLGCRIRRSRSGSSRSRRRSGSRCRCGGRRRRAVPGPALCAGRDDQQPRTGHRAASAAHDRRAG